MSDSQHQLTRLKVSRVPYFNGRQAGGVNRKGREVQVSIISQYLSRYCGPIGKDYPQVTSRHYVGIGQDQALGVPNRSSSDAAAAIANLDQASLGFLHEGSQICIQPLCHHGH